MQYINIFYTVLAILYCIAVVNIAIYRYIVSPLQCTFGSCTKEWVSYTLSVPWLPLHQG